jgi:hypothetical protein
MSLIFKKVVKTKMEEMGVPRTAYLMRYGTPKLVELFGVVSTLAANSTAKIIDWKVPDGYCAELFALGVQPDYDPTTGASNLLSTEIWFDDKATGIKFLTNHNGKNFLPFGDRACKQPLFKIDDPGNPTSLTVKYNEGMKIQLAVTTGPAAIVSPVRARAQVMLYEEADAQSIFGVPISNLASLPGGVMQEKPVRLFAEFTNNYATLARATWENAYSKEVKDYEAINLTRVGVAPDTHSDSLMIRDYRLKKEFPEYEPYWKINSAYNMLPFGDDDDEQAPVLPSIISQHDFTNTTLEIRVKDDGSASSTISIQVLGVYRRLV